MYVHFSFFKNKNQKIDKQTREEKSQAALPNHTEVASPRRFFLLMSPGLWTPLVLLKSLSLQCVIPASFVFQWVLYLFMEEHHWKYLFWDSVCIEWAIVSVYVYSFPWKYCLDKVSAGKSINYVLQFQNKLAYCSETTSIICIRVFKQVIRIPFKNGKHKTALVYSVDSLVVLITYLVVIS